MVAVHNCWPLPISWRRRVTEHDGENRHSGQTGLERVLPRNHQNAPRGKSCKGVVMVAVVVVVECEGGYGITCLTKVA